ncbi:MAG: tetratricopeptide repeat protein [Desulforegulaceae bacterium]|nr:tetratricopeptide repeat protein [Desulforegulaceae bacterium]
MGAKIIKKAETVNPAKEIFEDEFVKLSDLKISQSSLKNSSIRISGQISELSSQNKWVEIVELFHPLNDKLPEFANSEFEADLRSKISFALNQLKKFDEAIIELQTAVNLQPDRFMFHHSLAYTAYNSLYSAKNREVFLRGNHKKERIELARKHFQAAIALKPDTITNFYRMGMLVKEIEGKPDKSINYFFSAVKNWENLSNEEKEKRHQEKKNYIKALYQLSSVLLKSGKTNEPLLYLNKCIEYDNETNYLMPQNKYFALGKIYFALADYEKAAKNLEVAMEHSSKKEDFIIELLAKTYFFSDKAEKGLKTINILNPNYLKPYCRWTKADILCGLGKLEEAEQVLTDKIESDMRSRHKSLIKLSQLRYLRGDFSKALEFAVNAYKFSKETWNNDNAESIYLQAVCHFKLKNSDKAIRAMAKLKEVNPAYSKLSVLEEKFSSLVK